MAGDELAEATKRPRVPAGLPTSLASGKGYALYEDVDYREYWADPHLARQDSLEHALIAQMLPATGRRIVDVGGGYGRLSSCYVGRFDTSVVLDGSMSLLEKARRIVDPRVVLVAGDVLQLPFRPAAFDAVLNIRVLQHLPEVEHAVAELGRITAGGGQLVFSYHNKRNARRVAIYLAGKPIPSPFSLESAEVSPALISRHPAYMESLLAEHGFGAPEYRGAASIEGLEALAERLGARQPLGMRMAGFLGRHRLAPWLIGRSTATGGGPLIDAESVSDIFECPACHGSLHRTPDGFTCTACETHYPITNGIADFRPRSRSGGTA